MSVQASCFSFELFCCCCFLVLVILVNCTNFCANDVWLFVYPRFLYDYTVKWWWHWASWTIYVSVLHIYTHTRARTCTLLLSSPSMICKPLEHIIVCRVKFGWTAIQLRQWALVDNVRHHLGFGHRSTGLSLLDAISFCRRHNGRVHYGNDRAEATCVEEGQNHIYWVTYTSNSLSLNVIESWTMNKRNVFVCDELRLQSRICFCTSLSCNSSCTVGWWVSCMICCMLEPTIGCGYQW